MFWHPDISSEDGSLKALLKRGDFVDSSRKDRVVPYKIYHPSGGNLQKMPVIIWSHGFGGNRDGAGFISRFVASYGYVIVHITHRGTDSSLWEGKPGHPWDILKNIDVPRATTLNRFKDVSFVLDQLRAWAEENPDIGAFMDFDNIGMSGHSFGALTTQVMAGQMVPDETQALVSFHEKRFRAGIAYSPVPISHFTGTNTEKIYESISTPLFHMTGTDDLSPLESFGFEQRLMVYNATKNAEKYLLVLKGGDHMVYNGTRGKLGDNPLRERHENIIKLSSLAFWDWHLKDDKKAMAWLTEGGLPRYMAVDGEFRMEKP